MKQSYPSTTAIVSLCLLIGLGFSGSVGRSADASASRPNVASTSALPQSGEADLKDVGSLDAIIAALYDVISGPAGKKRNWERFRSLFLPGARLIPTNRDPEKAEAIVMDPEQFIGLAEQVFEKESFYERETARKTDSFGRITQVFSTYESLRSPTDKTPFSRGINSIQLLNDGKRWWVVTIFWDSERPGNPIPRAYQKR